MAQAKAAQAAGGRRAATPAASATSPVLGIVLVSVAALIGIMLLAKGGGDSGARVGTTPGPGVNATAGDPNAQAPLPTDPVSVVTTPAAQLKVIVANGSNIKGVAKKAKDQLAAAGYTLSTAIDASVSVTKSVVYFVNGADADARAVAEKLGLPADAIGLMPTSPPIKQQLGDAKLLVVLGPDSPQAGGTPAAAPPTSG